MTLALYTPKHFNPPPADPTPTLDVVIYMYVACALENGIGLDRTAVPE